MPDSRVDALAQTDDGYLWVATPRGLVRFDGHRFVEVGGDDQPLSQRAGVSALGAGKDGVLWIGTSDGALLSRRAGRIETVLPAGTPGLEGGIKILAEDSDGKLWITVNGDRVAVWWGGRLSFLSDQWLGIKGRSFQARTGPDRKVVINSDTGLWEPEGDGLLRIRDPGASGAVYHAPGAGGRYWLSDGERIMCWTAGTPEGDVKFLAPPRWGVRNLTFGIEDHAGALWLATQGHGLLRYDAEGGVAEVGIGEGLGANYVLCLLVDREGCVWAGTDGGGLSRILPAVFTRIDHSDGLLSDRVSAVCPDPAGGFLIGTKGDGVMRVREGRAERVGPEGTIWETADVAAIATGQDGWLWIGTWNAGLLAVGDGMPGWVDGIPSPKASATALLAEADGTLWVGRSGPVPLLRIKGTEVEEVSINEGSADVRALARAADGWLWIGTEHAGLFRLKDGVAEALGAPDGVTSAAVRSVLPVGDTVWVTTDGAGIWRWKDGELEACRAVDGLPDDKLRGLQIDQAGAFWVSSVRGLFRLESGRLDDWFDGKAERLDPVVFGGSDGLADLGGYGDTQACSAAGVGGKLYFATNRGVVEVRPELYEPPQVSPLVILEDFLVDGVKKSGEARINPGAKRFEFHFTGIGLVHPEGLAFECRLDGVDPDWVRLENQRSASYSTLAPGKHRFRVRVKDRGGRLSEEAATLSFTVLAPFWRTPWFIALASLAILIAVVGLVRTMAAAKLRRHLAQARIDQALVAERGRIARDMHDQLGAGLTELALLGDHLRHEQPGNADAGAVSRRARDLIRSMDETVWVLNPRNDSLEGMVNYLTRSVSEWVKHSPVRCRFVVAADYEDAPVRADLRHGLYLACKEAIHNVLKHAGASEVMVRIGGHDGWCEIEVADNGRGFPPGGPVAGNGLHNLRERMHGLGGDVSFSTAAAGGAAVTFRVRLDPCATASPAS